KGLDDVIGRHTDVRRSLLDHLQHRMQDADHGAKGPILALVDAAKAVEVAEQLVRAVHEMNDRAPVTQSGRRRGRHHRLCTSGSRRHSRRTPWPTMPVAPKSRTL